jgi:hypothetical protein
MRRRRLSLGEAKRAGVAPWNGLERCVWSGICRCSITFAGSVVVTRQHGEMREVPGAVPCSGE